MRTVIPSLFTFNDQYSKHENLTAYRTEIAQRFGADEESFELQYGIRTLQGDAQLADFGIIEEGVVSIHAPLDGGKRKRKKKVHTTPKRIAHVHRARPKALLEYFTVDDATMKVRRLKQESPVGGGVYMADHQDRYSCGRSGKSFFKLDKSGNRLPPPAQNLAKKAEKEKKEDPKKKKAGKK